jgi:V/A-type H+/Na+-transporting ATPase subunit I
VRWRDALAPARMDRVAVVAPVGQVRNALVAVADAGVLEPERVIGATAGPATAALQRVRRSGAESAAAPSAMLAHDAPDLDVLERDGRVDELAGEVELEEVLAAAVRRDDLAAVAGWAASADVDDLTRRLVPLGSAVVRMPIPRGVEPPTLVSTEGAAGTFQPLVDTYATVPYADVNPSIFAGVAYIVMFGMMFGDVGHGALLLVGGVLLHTGRIRSLAHLRRLAPFVIGAGLASMAFGLAYGEAFGPTKVVPTLWLSPLEHATTLLSVAVAVGAGLLTVSYALGTVNRWREGGARRALLAVSGLAGAGMYLGLALVGWGWYRHIGGLELAGGLLATGGLVLSFVGLWAEAGGRGSGVAQAGVGLFDAVIRLGTNTVSFTRLAAFGLTHAALEGIVWQGTTALWQRGSVAVLFAAAVFLVGNLLTFALEALVAGVQALRLEYYELFSRIFSTSGRAFRPWHVPTLSAKETP